MLKNTKMGTRSFNQVVGFQRIEELTKLIDPNTFRVLKEDCLDLPAKIYTTRYIDMTDDQANMYRKIQKEALVMLGDDEFVSAPAVITQMLRLQQILSGHLKTDDGDIVTFPTRRLDALMDICNETSGKMIIWSRFRQDIITITETLKKTFGDQSAASFFGDTTENERQQIIHDFQFETSGLRFLVGNPATAGRGLTLNAANTVVYYANDFNLDTRSQSEDRCHRIGQTKSVTYIDLLCEKSIDDKIVKSLQSKIGISAQGLGEEAREWLTLNPK